MPVVHGELKLKVRARAYQGLQERIREFIEHKMGESNNLPIQFYFQDMSFNHGSSPHYTAYSEMFVESALIPFKCTILDRHSRYTNQVEMEFTLKRAVARQLQDLIPDAYDGIVNLRVINEYGYDYNDYGILDRSYSGTYGSSRSSGLDYDYDNPDYGCDSYSYGDDNFHGCNLKSSNKKAAPVPPVEVALVIEKSSNARKLFILNDEDEGD